MTNRGSFQHMTSEKQRDAAAKGGRAAHQKGTAHEWTTDEARVAGRRGGLVSNKKCPDCLKQLASNPSCATCVKYKKRQLLSAVMGPFGNVLKTK